MPLTRKATASMAAASIATASAVFALAAGPAAADVFSPMPVYASGAPAPVAYKTYTATTAATASSPVAVTLTMKQTSALDFSVTSAASDSTSGATFAESGSVIVNGENQNPDIAAFQDFTGTEWDGSIDYAMPGTYTVTNTVTDSNGASATVSLVVTTVGSAYTAVNPTRLLDTRNGTGAARAKVGKKGLVKLKVAGVGPIPADGVTAAVLNVTVTDAVGSGFITAYPSDDGTSAPNVSNVNYVTGQTVPNLVTVPVGSDGYVYLGNSAGGSVDLIADITGYYHRSAGDLHEATYTPMRLLDTRNGTGAAKARVGKGGIVSLLVAQNDTYLPAPGDMDAVVVNLTVTDTTGSGFITGYADGASVPNASNVNYAAGQTVANLAIVPVSSAGKIDLFNGGGSVDLIADVVGYYSKDVVPQVAGAYVPVTPTRVFDSRGLGDTPLPNDRADTLVLGTWADPVNALVANTTVTDTKGDGFLTVYTYDQSVPNASNLNWTRGATVPNMAVPTVFDERLNFYNGGANGGYADVIVDVFGYFQPQDV